LAHNARIHTAVTGWPPGYVVTQADWLTIDTLLFQAANFDLGGTWAPASVITIGGAGVVLTAKTTFDGDTEFNAQNQFDDIVVFSGTSFVTASGNVVCDAASTVEFQSGFTVSTGDIVVTAGDVTVTAGSVAITAGGLTVGGATIVQGFTALGATSLAAATAVSLGVASVIVLDATTLSTTSAVTAAFAGPVNVSNTLTMASAAITFSGTGRILQRFHTLPDADATVTIADGNYFIIPALGALRTYTMSTTGALAGDIVTFSAYANTGANAGFVGAWGLVNTTGQVAEASFYFSGGSWLTLSTSLIS
jgi:hypothetical protein